MTLGKTSIRRLVVLGAFALGAFAVITTLAAAPTPSAAVLVTVNGKNGRGEHALQIIDPLTAKVVGNVPISGGEYAHEVTASADGKLAFVTNSHYASDYAKDPPDPQRILNGYISVIDLVAQKELRRIEIGPDSLPHGMQFAGGKVYFTAEGYQNIGRYDPATNKIDWMFGLGHPTHLLVFSKHTNKIFTASTSTNSVIAIEPWDDRAGARPSRQMRPMMETVIPVGQRPEGIAMSPDEKEVWTLTRRDGGVSIIDVATKKVSQTLDLRTKNPLRIDFTPDGKRAIIIDGDTGDVLVLDAVTRKEIKRITNVGSGVHGVAISSDGSHAYAAGGHYSHVQGSNKVAVIDLKTLELTGQIVVGEDPDGMAWAERR